VSNGNLPGTTETAIKTNDVMLIDAQETNCELTGNVAPIRTGPSRMNEGQVIHEVRECAADPDSGVDPTGRVQESAAEVVRREWVDLQEV
jgi:hypothetical protein